MQLRAQNGQISLLTITKPSLNPEDVRMQVSLSLEPATLIEEGTCALHYQQLLHAAKTLPGMLTLQLQEQTVLVSGEGSLVHQMEVEVQPGENFPTALFVERREDEIYTTERWVTGHCYACKSYQNQRVVDTYQVTSVKRQALRVSHELLSSMCKQVLWVVEPEGNSRQAWTSIQVELIDHVLSFVGASGYCVVKRSQHLPNAGSWPSPVLIPGARLAQALKLLPNTEILIESVVTEHQLMHTTENKPSQRAASIVRSELVRLSAANISVTISLIDVPFPNYRAAIPSSFEAQRTCETSDERNETL